MSGDQYREAIGAVARSAEMPPERAARIERDLLHAFAEYHAAQALARPTRVRARWWPWLGAAAALVAIGAGIESRRAWRGNTNVTLNHVTAQVRPPVLASESLASAGSDSGAPSISGAQSTPTSRTSISSSRVSPVRGRRADSRVVRPSGFVALPGTAGLPQFESGTIVRIELPVASLPAYGVDISPAADDQPVEADVLVGQDGQPRAIRLVTNSSRSGQ
jgi:hypothetical protein